MKRILVIDDDASIALLLQRFLTKKGFQVEAAYSSDSGIEKFKKDGADLVLCDYRLDAKNGGDVLKAVKVIDPSAIFIMITGYSDLKTAVAIVKDGAYDYVSKPLIPDDVLNIINQALQQKEDSRKQPASDERNTGADKNGTTSTTVLPSFNINEIMKGEAAEIKELFKQIELVAPTNYSVIIYGESGTGKEVMARAIHQSSTRSEYPFVALDCGTLSKELACSEMFGHVKGSFTGAVTDKVGHFEMAHHGTLFLDEVGNLSIDVQASLLRVLQERRFKRVGGTQEIEADIRVLVASNENLKDACLRGRFREDLYHRLNEFSLEVPPLRDRKEDIPLFAEYFLAKANKELNKEVTGFEPEVMEMFLKYPWPGNLREMMNVIRRMTLLTKKNNPLTTKNLPLEISKGKSFSWEAERTFPNANDGHGLKDAASRAEYDTILSVLKQVKYNKSKAAALLHIDRKTLYNKLKSDPRKERAANV